MSQNGNVEKITELLGVIINPNNGKTLKEEGRIAEIKADQTELLFKYKRDGISPEQKKAIESSIVSALADFYPAEKITILTISENSSDVFAGKTFSKVEDKKKFSQKCNT